MRKWIEGFANDEDGAITVDWVVLTALVVGVQVMLLVGHIREKLVGTSEAIGETVSIYGEYLDE